jgi:hypothetical protein
MKPYGTLPHSNKNGFYQKDTVTSIGENVEKRENFYTVRRNVIRTAIMRNM